MVIGWGVAGATAGLGKARVLVLEADRGLVGALIAEGAPGFGEAGPGRVALS